jgi:serine/threonine protein phosphatase PrpC
LTPPPVPDVAPPVLGRPSAAAGNPTRLREVADAGTAALRAEGGAWGSWALRAASVAGVRHRLAGRPVEDAYAWRTAGELLVAAVADGVGSLAGSAETARLAADAACRATADAAADVEPPAAVLAGVAAANQAVAGTSGATTLVVAVVDIEGAAWVARVGDSSAWHLGAGGWEELFPAPGGEDVASTATPALPSPAPPVEVADVGIAFGEALVLLTDGIADPMRDGPTTVAPALAEALAEPPSPLALAALADFSRQGCHDDRTVVALWRRPAVTTPSPPAPD